MTFSSDSAAGPVVGSRLNSATGSRERGHQAPSKQPLTAPGGFTRSRFLDGRP
jgi:hypothetical protein